MNRKNPRKGKDLTKGGVWKTLFLLAGPVVAGMLLRIGLNITDTFFVGMLGTDQLAAISVTFPVFFIFIAVASGLAIGSTALISQAIGGKHKKLANNIAEHSLLIAGITGAIISVLALIFSPQLFTFMGVSGDILAMTLQYSNLIFIGFVFVFLDSIAQGIINADGNTTTPARNLFIAFMFNVVLDPLLIFGIGPFPRLGLFGAAVATVFAEAISIFLNISYVLRGRTSVTIDPKCFRWNSSIFRKIITIGLPSSVSQSINSIGLILLMGLVGGFGVNAIAAFGVGIRLESLAILPIIGLATAVIPFVGQNLGAGKPERARKAVTAATFAAFAFMVFFSIVWFFVPQIIFSPFTSDPEVLAIGAAYFQIIAFGYVFLGMNIIIGSAFQGAGRTDLQFVINIVRWALIVGVAYGLVGIFGLNGIWMGFPIGNFFAFLVSFSLLKTGAWLKG
ncbi:MAG: MATE family efflux transporter [Candidatus Aenigmarchaeota archaeon]|nr:MATE family efflux transporter [Candidatus Aenigmarchaeota archaeon]